MTGGACPKAEGSQEARLYDWAKPAKGSIARSAMAEVWPAEGGLRLFHLQAPLWDHWLLIRRPNAAPAGMAFHVTFGPHTTDLNERAAAACLRWTIACFQSAKRETGLDRCEARSWHGGHRQLTLSMLALTFLAGLRARLKEAQTGAASTKANEESPSAAA